MVTFNKISWINGKKFVEGACLSTDTKPTDNVLMNGSILMEMNTSKMFIFDEANNTWREWS